MYGNVQKRGSAKPISSENGEEPMPARKSVSAHGVPGKNDDFGGVFLPFAGELFCVTENISSNGKHNLLSPEHTMFRGSKTGRISRPVPACLPTCAKRQTTRSRNRLREQNRSKWKGPKGSPFQKVTD